MDWKKKWIRKKYGLGKNMDQEKYGLGKKLD